MTSRRVTLGLLPVAVAMAATLSHATYAPSTPSYPGEPKQKGSKPKAKGRQLQPQIKLSPRQLKKKQKADRRALKQPTPQQENSDVLVSESNSTESGS